MTSETRTSRWCADVPADRRKMDRPAARGVASGSDNTGSKGTKMAGLDTILETMTAERPATGFVFTEGPLWHPDGIYYFADVRSSVFYRLRLGPTPGNLGNGASGGQGNDLR